MANIIYTNQPISIDEEIKDSLPIPEASSTPPAIDAELIQESGQGEVSPQLIYPSNDMPATGTEQEVRVGLVKRTKEIKRLMSDASIQLDSLANRLFKLAEDLNSIYKR